MNKLFFVIYSMFVFGLGMGTTYLVMMKSQIDRVMQGAATTQARPTSSTIVSNPIDTVMNTTDGQAPTLNDFSEQDAKALLDSTPDAVLNQYVDKFMMKGDSDKITDKRQFAERAIEELYKKNDTTPLVGEIKLSMDSSTPSQSMNTQTLGRRDKLYAHLDTFGKVPSNGTVFVKWVNNNTGQVLLFENKPIMADSHQNWVSFQPYDGWQVGSYDVKYYEFNSELKPIAQMTYYVGQVNE
ncbi:MAG: hypothetical protein Q4G13_10095 [Moraxella sp.]|nr:hypothetical protein [Moraxella sp.]